MSGIVAQAVKDTKFEDSPPRPNDPNPLLRVGVSGRILKNVLVSIALRARDNGTDAYPGVRGIARQEQIHFETARRALAHLIADEWIFLQRRGDKRRADMYSVNLAKLSPSDRVTRGHLGPSDPASHAVSERASDAGSERASGRGHNVLTSIRPAADAASSVGPCGHSSRAITTDGECARCLNGEPPARIAGAS